MKVGHYQDLIKRNPLQRCDGFFVIWGLVNSQYPMPNSVVAAPSRRGICIPIHQTNSSKTSPTNDSVVFAMRLSTAVGTMTLLG